MSILSADRDPLVAAMLKRLSNHFRLPGDETCRSWAVQHAMPEGRLGPHQGMLKHLKGGHTVPEGVPVTPGVELCSRIEEG